MYLGMKNSLEQVDSHNLVERENHTKIPNICGSIQNIIVVQNVLQIYWNITSFSLHLELVCYVLTILDGTVIFRGK